MKSATAILRTEHEAILKMLVVLENTAQRLEQGEAVPPALLDDLLEFFTVFADRCHHGKEEDLLFPLLEQKGMPRIGGPVGCMLVEHDQGRAFIQTMRNNGPACAAGDKGAKSAWAAAARGYANLLRNHIWKENEVLFRLADQMISQEEQETLTVEFERIEETKLGAGVHAQLHSKMEKLVQELAPVEK